MKKITHRQAHIMFQASIDRKLPARGQARLDAHLAECRDCRQYASEIRGLEADLFRVWQARWDGKTRNFSNASIQTRLRKLRMQNTIWNSVKTFGVIVLVAALWIIIDPISRLRDASSPNEPAAGEFTSEPATATPSEPTVQEITSIPTATETQTTPTPQISERLTPGDWVATTAFGKLILTVRETGTYISKISYQFSEWTCGSITSSSEIVDASGWMITDNKFSVISTFDREGRLEMTLNGEYKAGTQILSGTWVVASGNTVCGGKWEAVASPAPLPLTTADHLLPDYPVYQVQQFDTCASIAAAFNVAIETIIQENDVGAHCENLYVGQKLVIPRPTP